MACLPEIIYTIQSNEVESTHFEAAAEILRRRPEEVEYVANAKCVMTSTGECVPVLQFLASSQKGGHMRDDKISVFLKAIRDADPSVFLHPFPNGKTMLEIACHEGDDFLPLIQFLLEIYIAFDFKVDGKPMYGFKNSPFKHFRFQADITCAHREEDGDYVINCGDNNDDCGQVLFLLIRAFYYKTVADKLKDDRAFRLLHACAGIPCFPKKLLRRVMTVFPDELYEEDEDGNLPLHVAALSGAHRANVDVLLDETPDVIRRRNRTGKLPLELALEKVQDWKTGGITSLLEAFPEAVQVRSASGKYPLQVAIEGRQDYDKGIQRLVKIYPPALVEVDFHSGLSMYALAAANNYSISAIYNLLRACPLAAESSRGAR